MIFQKPLFLLMTQNYNILIYLAAHTCQNNLQVLNAGALVNNLRGFTEQTSPMFIISFCATEVIIRGQTDWKFI